MTSERVAPTGPAAAQKPPRRRRGLLDTLLVVALGYGVYAATPLGAIVETAVRVARGQKDHPSWFSTFRGRETAVAAPTVTPSTENLLAGALPASLVTAADRHGVDVDALAALVAVRGGCNERGRCTATAPDRLAVFAPGKVGVVDVDALAVGLAAAQAELATKNTELALEALFTGPHALRLAVRQAESSRLDAPEDVEVHAPFFSPGMRRGALQGALAVLLVHRLRTLAWPAEGFRVTSPFGERIHPVTGQKSFHNGTDIGTPTGTPLHSAHNGAIKRVSRDSISGNYVVVDHGLGVQTTYCHMDEVQVREKQRTRRRDVLGLSGATGRVTGPHLHYILRIADKAVDAEQYGGRRQGLTPAVPSLPPTTAPGAPPQELPSAQTKATHRARQAPPSPAPDASHAAPEPRPEDGAAPTAASVKLPP